WVTTPRVGDANQAVVPGIMRAYNAETLAVLWDSGRPADDTLNFAKFAPPVVVAGKVYVGSFSKQLSVYGLRPTPPANLALNKGATGSASCNANETPAQAVNGSTFGGNTDKWCSLAAGTKTLTIDLGSVQTVAKIVVRHAGSGGEDPAWNTKDFSL